MTIQPTHTTESLVLRPFNIGDCQQVALLAGDKLIADMTANIPHPYELPKAQAWIDRHATMYQQHQGVAYAITLRNTGELLGAESLPRIEEWYGTLG
ncbi:acetyltransferase, partial [Vibrio parahaemolyticus]|uniref:GNAT family N-acetyltransferase n=1 Tax=Vibrio parahaemolyticus TaxID=670 RepID=UPI00062B1988